MKKIFHGQCSCVKAEPIKNINFYGISSVCLSVHLFSVSNASNMKSKAKQLASRGRQR